MYVEQFKNNQDIADEFAKHEIEKEEIFSLLNNSIIHLAWYGCGNYCGDSWVIYENQEGLYEVQGGHCSCHGLEGQWAPEKTSWESIRIRNFKLSDDYDEERTVEEYMKDLLARML